MQFPYDQKGRGRRWLKQQKETFNCMVVEMRPSCVYTDFPIKVGTGKIAFLMGETQFNVTFSNE
ncbi:hypothetical protein SRABI133_02595 [Peribacillus simplex]|uniref:Uncharacterized protein n=1 Tax=Peribacillus simplex TaxID=1478 RepID=A0A9W4KX06_9BACI|nr:hypothetical protein SRABI133_02595 [Peribacillus simplex]